MLTLKAKSIYNDFVGIKVADFILTITLYIDKCLSLTTAIVSDRFSFAEENIMEKTGIWKFDNRIGYKSHYCSFCTRHTNIITIDDLIRCPNCGAKMTKIEKGETNKWVR